MVRIRLPALCSGSTNFTSECLTVVETKGILELAAACLHWSGVASVPINAATRRLRGIALISSLLGNGKTQKCLPRGFWREHRLTPRWSRLQR